MWTNYHDNITTLLSLGRVMRHKFANYIKYTLRHSRLVHRRAEAVDWAATRKTTVSSLIMHRQHRWFMLACHSSASSASSACNMLLGNMGKQKAYILLYRRLAGLCIIAAASCYSSAGRQHSLIGPRDPTIGPQRAFTILNSRSCNDRYKGIVVYTFMLCMRILRCKFYTQLWSFDC